MQNNSPTPLSRRTLVAAGAVAAVAGLVTAVWRERSVPVVAEPAPGFWGLEWDSPQGTRIRLVDFRGRPLLLNFWATWCPPCVEELPRLNAFYLAQRSQGWQVLGVAADMPSPVQAFLHKMPLDFPVALAGASAVALSRSLGNLVGGLPFTLVLTSDGAVAQRKTGPVTEQELVAWVGLK
jgi:peroxiredoxin